MKNVVLVIVSVMVGLLIVLFADGIAAVAAPGQIVHVLGGKTGAEYSAVVANLAQSQDDLTSTKDSLTKAKGDLDRANGQITDLQNQLKTANDQIGSLNSKITGLQGQLASWNALLCSHTWGEMENNPILFELTTSYNSVFHSLGFYIYGTQWKLTLDQSKPITTVIVDVNGGIALDVTDHCVIFKSAVGGTSD